MVNVLMTFPPIVLVDVSTTCSFISYELINKATESWTQASTPCFGCWSACLSCSHWLRFEHGDDDCLEHFDTGLCDVSIFLMCLFLVTYSALQVFCHWAGTCSIRHNLRSGPFSRMPLYFFRRRMLSHGMRRRLFPLCHRWHFR